VSVQAIRPSDEAGVADAVRAAAEKGTALEIVSAGTKRALGCPVSADAMLDTSALSGIVKYEPEELVLTARASTPLADIDAALRAKNQMLGFEPADWGPLFGTSARRATLAGTVAANACGSRRIKAGAVRDAAIGCRFVNGSGEIIQAGGHVIKNVTGFDLPKLMCGAYGTLGVLTELTLRVSPAPERVATLVLKNRAADDGLRALREAAGLPVDASGLAYLAAEDCAYVRVEGTPAGVAEKLHLLRTHFADHDLAILEDDETRVFFRDIGDGRPFVAQESDIWRLSVPASEAYLAVETAHASVWYADWAGGLLWLALPATEEIAARLHAITGRLGGHTTLFRATSEARSRLQVFEPESAARVELTRAVKAAFDPKHVLNPGRMYKDI
jgi:glycolate oxidase FAD binding subunit